MARRGVHAWLHELDDEDLSFIKRFLFASGSLKDLAAAYGISYPTVRLRLDRLIEKIKVLDSRRPMSDFERVLRAHAAEGKLDTPTLKALLAAHEKDLEATREEADHADDRAGDVVDDAKPRPVRNARGA